MVPKDPISAYFPNNSFGFQILGQAWRLEEHRTSRMSSDQQKHSVAVAQGGSSSLQPTGESFPAVRGISSIQDRLHRVSRALDERGEALTKIPHCETTEVAEKACVLNQDADENGEH